MKKSLSEIDILDFFFKIRTDFCRVSTFSRPGVIYIYIFSWNSEYILENISRI